MHLRALAGILMTVFMLSSVYAGQDCIEEVVDSCSEYESCFCETLQEAQLCEETVCDAYETYSCGCEQYSYDCNPHNPRSVVVGYASVSCEGTRCVEWQTRKETVYSEYHGRYIEWTYNECVRYETYYTTCPGEPIYATVYDYDTCYGYRNCALCLTDNCIQAHTEFYECSSAVEQCKAETCVSHPEPRLSDVSYNNGLLEFDVYNILHGTETNFILEIEGESSVIIIDYEPYHVIYNTKSRNTINLHIEDTIDGDVYDDEIIIGEDGEVHGSYVYYPFIPRDVDPKSVPVPPDQSLLSSVVMTIGFVAAGAFAIKTLNEKKDEVTPNKIKSSLLSFAGVIDNFFLKTLPEFGSNITDFVNGFIAGSGENSSIAESFGDFVGGMFLIGDIRDIILYGLSKLGVGDREYDSFFLGFAIFGIATEFIDLGDAVVTGFKVMWKKLPNSVKKAWIEFFEKGIKNADKIDSFFTSLTKVPFEKLTLFFEKVSLVINKVPFEKIDEVIELFNKLIKYGDEVIGGIFKNIDNADDVIKLSKYIDNVGDGGFKTINKYFNSEQVLELAKNSDELIFDSDDLIYYAKFKSANEITGAIKNNMFQVKGADDLVISKYFDSIQVKKLNEANYNVFFSKSVFDNEYGEFAYQTFEDIGKQSDIMADFAKKNGIDYETPKNFLIKVDEGDIFSGSSYSRGTRSFEIDIYEGSKDEIMRRIRHEKSHDFFTQAINNGNIHEKYVEEVGTELTGYKIYGESYKEQVIKRLKEIYSNFEYEDFINVLKDSNSAEKLKIRYYIAKEFGIEDVYKKIEEISSFAPFSNDQITRIEEIKKVINNVN